ncbi:DUF2752 domain-containing protein [Pedococcus sp. KACC 23699]|uniref:DUF2752 domain-containing protein n=1 Tax=Pedococcus sp. KACC 23699 TaxID=3149228 RepID=A0AAU7JXB4_9MICO
MTIQHAAHLDLVGRVRGVLLPVASAGAALAGGLVVALVDPNEAGHYPTCPFLALTGAYCPGCGSLRAIHALARGDVATAMARNPFAVVALVGLVVGWVLWTWRLWNGRRRTWVVPAWAIHAFLAAVMAFWVLRNVPGWTWLSPA